MGIFKLVGISLYVGIFVTETTVKMDAKGRIRIPRKFREAIQLSEGGCVNIKSEGKVLIIEASESIADKYYGIVHVENWPEDLEEYAKTEMLKRWKQRVTM